MRNDNLDDDLFHLYVEKICGIPYISKYLVGGVVELCDRLADHVGHIDRVKLVVHFCHDAPRSLILFVFRPAARCRW